MPDERPASARMRVAFPRDFGAVWRVVDSSTGGKTSVWMFIMGSPLVPWVLALFEISMTMDNDTDLE
jgi:hypothetical protein